MSLQNVVHFYELRAQVCRTMEENDPRRIHCTEEENLLRRVSHAYIHLSIKSTERPRVYYIVLRL